MICVINRTYAKYSSNPHFSVFFVPEVVRYSVTCVKF